MDQTIADFLVHFIVESDAIEGMVNNPNSVRREIEDETHDDGGRKDGHIAAMLFLEALSRDKRVYVSEFDARISQSLIVGTQYLKKTDLGGDVPAVEKKYRGNYRDQDVFVNAKKQCHPLLIVPRMQELMTSTRAWQRGDSQALSFEDNVRFVSGFHFDFERIHPFIDGNGRTGRALVYYLFRYLDRFPPVFTSKDKWQTYYRCFKRKKEMERYFFKKLNLPYSP